MLRPACFSTTIDPIAAKKEFRKTLAQRQQTALEGGGRPRLEAQVCGVHPGTFYPDMRLCVRVYVFALLNKRFLTD